MAIYKTKKPRTEKIEVDLNGPDGNFYSLASLGLRLCDKLGLGEVYKRSFIVGMRAGHYAQALEFFESCFGEYVDLYKGDDDDDDDE